MLEPCWGAARPFLLAALLVAPASTLHAFHARQSVPRNVPAALEVDGLFLAVLVVDRARGRSLCSLYPEHDTLPPGGAAIPRTRMQLAAALRTWYRLTVGAGGFPFPLLDGAAESDAHAMVEAYACGTDHKAYAIRRGTAEIFALLHPTAPTFAMRAFAADMLTRALALLD